MCVQVAALDDVGHRLGVANVGDSGIIVFRYGGWLCVWFIRPWGCIAVCVGMVWMI